MMLVAVIGSRARYSFVGPVSNVFMCLAVFLSGTYFELQLKTGGGGLSSASWMLWH